MPRNKNSQRSKRVSSYRRDPTITIIVGQGSEIELPAASTETHRWDYDALVNQDDYISMAQQFTEFRIKSMRFRITDLQPHYDGAVINYWSTYHAIGETPLGITQIVDRADVKSLSPTTGSLVMHWHARGVNETKFQTTAGTPGSYINYGGLGAVTRNFFPVTNGPKFNVVAQYEVEFRGRK